MSKRLVGKSALITGSSSGLGRAIAHAFAAEGAQICCIDLYPSLRNPINTETGKADDIHNRTESGIATDESLRDKYGGDHFFVKTDVTDAGDVEAAVGACVSTFGRLDVLVCCAGISVESTHVSAMRIHETEESDYDKTMAVNAKGVFLCCKYGVRQMLGQEPLDGEGGDRGWIVNVASVQALVGYWGTPSYCASKGACLQLTRQIALDYAKDRIHCNAVCPGFLKTAMTQNLQSNPELLKTINEAHPLGGMGDPEDVARTAVFLASSDVRWVTGVALNVDGGYLLQ